MAVNYTPVQKGKHVRVWLALNGLSPSNTPVLEGYMIPDAVSFNQNVDIVRKKYPSATQRGVFETAYTVVQRSDAEITTGLANRLPADMRSLFVKLALSGCKFDMIYSYGVCSEPNIYNDFDKLEIFEGVSVTGYQHDQAGAFDETTLTDDVLENLELTSDKYYEYAKPEQRVALTDTDTYRAVRISDSASCGGTGDCSDEEKSDGCQKMFAVSEDATNVQLNYSADGGKNWKKINTGILLTDYDAVDVANAAGQVIISGSGADNSRATYYFAPLADIVAAADGATVAFTAVAAAGQHPGGKVFVGSGYVFFAGAAGQLLYLPLSQVGVAPDAVPGAYAAGDYEDIAGISDNHVVACAAAGQVTVIGDFTGEDVTAVPGVPDLVGVHPLDEVNTVVLTADGQIFSTTDSGMSWTAGINLGTVGYALTFANGAIGYAVVDTYLYASADGGASWYRLSNTAHTAGASTISACDNGNMVAYNGSAEVMIAEDALRRQYGAV